MLLYFLLPISKYLCSFVGGGTGINQPKCPESTYSNRTGLEHFSECWPCIPGYYCADPGLIEPTGPCIAGELCQMYSQNFGNHEITMAFGKIRSPCFTWMTSLNQCIVFSMGLGLLQRVGTQ